MSPPLIFGSLFSGVGGLDLGMERAGLVCRWQVEADPYCRRVLARHWPDVARFEDVRDVGSRNLARVDVLAGGFPCQDLSNSGRRAGIEGARSGLWRQFARLIEELQPRYVLIENVAALLQRNNRFDIVLRDLAARGYDAGWDILPAAAFGAPHLRERVFIIAWRSHAWRQSRAGAVAGPHGLPLADAGRPGWRDGAEPQLFQGHDINQFRPWASAQSLECIESSGRFYPGLPAHLRMDDGLPAGLDIAERRKLGAHRVKGCGNAVAPVVGEHAARCLLGWHMALSKATQEYSCV